MIAVSISLFFFLMLMPLCNIVDCSEIDDLTASLAGYGGWLVMEAGWLFSSFCMEILMEKQENYKGVMKSIRGSMKSIRGSM